MKTTFRSLSNGIRLGVARNMNLNSIVAMVGVQVGSRHEPKGLYGAAHFVEHMLFKGTKSRPTSKALSELIESRGGDNNAFTSKESTSFHVRMSKHDGEMAVDVVHDLIENSLFRTRDVEKERSVIREEISMYDNEPDSNVWDLSESVAFDGCGLAHRITGSIEDVGFSPSSLREFFKTRYIPSRMIVMLAGAVDEKIVGTAISKFGKIKSVSSGLTEVTPAPLARIGSDFKVGKTDRLHIVVRFPGIRQSHPESRALEIVSLCLGGYSSARLFQSLREKHGLCYGIGSSLYGYSDTGSIVIYTSLDRPKFVPAMKAILKEIASIRKHGFKPEEIKNAKSHRRGGQLLEFDRPMSVAQDAIQQMFTNGYYEDPETKIAKFMRTSEDKINEVIEKYLDPNKIHISVIGPAAAKREVLSALKNLDLA